jgi:cytidyltransferase-like protein
MAKVFLNGCFDILHPGHFNLLMFARQIAKDGIVMVAIDEDEKVMADKGLQRPIFNVHERAKAVLDLRMIDRPLVDQVDFFYTNHQLENIIRREKPDYIVKGGDWRGKTVVGSQYAKVLYYDRMQHSTSEIIRRVIEKHTILK